MKNYWGGEMRGNVEEVKKRLEYERDCLQDCLNRDISGYIREIKNAALYYQFVREDLSKIERLLEEYDRKKLAAV